LWNGRLDRLVGGQLGLGVEVEIAVVPGQRADHGVVAGHAFIERVKEMSEQEIKSAAAAVVAQRERAGGALGLRLFQQRSKLDFGKVSLCLQQRSPKAG